MQTINILLLDIKSNASPYRCIDISTKISNVMEDSRELGQHERNPGNGKEGEHEGREEMQGGQLEGTERRGLLPWVKPSKVDCTAATQVRSSAALGRPVNGRLQHRGL